MHVNDKSGLVLPPTSGTGTNHSQSPINTSFILSHPLWDNVSILGQKGHHMQNSKESARSWFCVLNNPQNLFENLTPVEMVEHAIELWCNNKPQRTCAVNYEIGDNGTPHMHMVLEDPSKVRFSALQKLFKGIHIEPTRGTKEQAEDYINKRGRFEEKNHTVVVPAIYHGTIKANQGARNDLDVIQELLEQGKTPNEIMDISIHYRKYETLIRKQFNRMRSKDMNLRTVTTYWHVGESGCGKSHSLLTLKEQYGAENIYFLTDYENGGFDNYCAEKVLFMDEFKGNMRFQILLNYLDVYPIQIHCRYANSNAFWTEVHITSVFPPEEAYNFMVEESQRNKDKIQQLLRRIHAIVYHYKQNGEYKTFELPMEQYINYEQLKALALSPNHDGFLPITEFKQENIPFET